MQPRIKVFRLGSGGAHLEIPATREAEVEHHKFKASLGNLVRPCLKINKKELVVHTCKLSSFERLRQTDHKFDPILKLAKQSLKIKKKFFF